MNLKINQFLFSENKLSFPLHTLLCFGGLFLLIPNSKNNIIILLGFSIIHALLFLKSYSWVKELKEKKLFFQSFLFKKTEYLPHHFLFSLFPPAVFSILLFIIFNIHFFSKETFFIQFILLCICAISFYWSFLTTENKKYIKNKFQLRDLEQTITFTQKQSLQDMISPHFLFNSLNTLTSIVSESKGKAIRFSSELAYLYNFILTHKEDQIIPLEDELNLVQRYVYLLESRFEDALQMKINIDKTYYNSVIPPLAIQNLIENAIKHNGASKKKPLKVEVYVNENYIIVKNNLIPKKSPVSSSTGIGIQYIKNYYEKIQDKKIVILNENEQFTVKLPLITSPQLASK